MVWEYPAGCSPWHLSQMAGNVWEWCADWYANDAYDRYRRGDLQPPQSGQWRGLRGGSWDYDSPDRFRCAYRYLDGPAYRYLNDLVFRCARALL